MKIVYCIIISLLIGSIWGENGTREKPSGNYKAIASDGPLYFDNLFYTPYKSESDLNMAKLNESDSEQMIFKGNFYFITGSLLPQGDRKGVEYIKKSLDIYQKIWKNDFSNARVRTLLATAHMARGGDSNISIEEILDHIFRAKNLFSMVLSKYPENLDALIGRIRLDMNLTTGTGRSNIIHESDIRLFFTGYNKLSNDLKTNPYFLMAFNEVLLASARLDLENGKIKSAENSFKSINKKALHEHGQKMYDETLKSLENYKGEK